MRKLAILGGVAMAASLVLQLAASSVYASKVDCDKVMAELGSGKKVSEVAKDQKISRSSVYRCRKLTKQKEKKGAAAASPAAMTSPAAAVH